MNRAYLNFVRLMNDDDLYYVLMMLILERGSKNDDATLEWWRGTQLLLQAKYTPWVES